MAKLDWLDKLHPIYEANREEWVMNERRLRGGVEVLSELRKFAYEEVVPGMEKDAADRAKAAYDARVQQAIYPNFPDMLASSMVGHLMREQPAVDHALTFGTLGRVARDDGQKDPSLAELIYYNVDGIGNDGSEWPNWWTNVAVRAMGTGFRWILCDLPVDASSSLADVLAGARPFLVDLSPLAVTNWHLSRGSLEFAVLRIGERRPRVDEQGEFEGNDFEAGYLLFTKQGYEDLGKEFAGGGWWKYDADKELMKVENVDQTGTWETFKGMIPMWPHFYERDPGTTERPAMARSAITVLGQAGVAYMNLESAAQFDAWDAAMSMQFFLGVEPDNFNDAVNQAKLGYRWIGVKLTQPPAGVGDLTPPPASTPLIHDGSTGSVPSEVFSTILDRIVENAGKTAAQEATSTPDSSGRSKEAGFSDLKAPRLALMASEHQQSQNTAIHFLEQAFGAQRPEGVVRWTREFNLLSLREKVTGIFDLVDRAGVRSSRLDARALSIAAREDGIIVDDDEAAAVEEELVAAARVRQLGEIELALALMSGTAKVPAIMDDLEAMGLFVTVDESGDEVDRTVPVVGEDGTAGGVDPETGEATGASRPLRDVVLEALTALAESADRKAMQESSIFDLGPPPDDTDAPNPNGDRPPPQEPQRTAPPAERPIPDDAEAPAATDA